MDSTRPLILLLYVIGIGALFYGGATTEVEGDGGIWKVWEVERIHQHKGSKEPTRLSVDGWDALKIGFYFSVMSSFRIGWRDLNVGSWISRIQPNEYNLRATGWVRAFSGLQSLISVYLLALWALTTFGRPFE